MYNVGENGFEFKQRLENYDITPSVIGSFNIGFAANNIFALLTKNMDILFFSPSENAKTWVEHSRIKLPFNSHRVLFNPNATAIAAKIGDNEIIVTDIPEQKVFLRLNLASYATKTSLRCFSPDGQTFVTCDDKNRVMLWDLTQGSFFLKQTLSGHNEPIMSSCFCPDGLMFATGDKGNNIILWDLSREEPSIKQSFYSNYYGNIGVWDLSFSIDGKYLAAANVAHRRFMVYEIGEDGITENYIEGHDYFQVKNTIFSPNGRNLITANIDEIILWEYQ